MTTMTGARDMRSDARIGRIGRSPSDRPPNVEVERRARRRIYEALYPSRDRSNRLLGASNPRPYRPSAAYEAAVAFATPQQPLAVWTGGHLTEPYEQKTQQSPGFGRSTTPQRLHS